MAKVTIAEWYERVESLYAPFMPMPQLTADEARRAAKKLYRFALRRKMTIPVVVTSGNRYSYIHGGALHVNPARGWHSFIHGLSHTFHRRITSDRPHGGEHARLEMRMIKEAIKRGWFSGSLKTEEKAPIEMRGGRATKFLQVETAIIRWERKLKRAQTALAKLRRKQKYYARSQQQSATNTIQ